MKNTIKGGIAALGIAGAMAAGIGAGDGERHLGPGQRPVHPDAVKDHEDPHHRLVPDPRHAPSGSLQRRDNESRPGPARPAWSTTAHGTFTWQGARSFAWDSVTVFCPQFLPGGFQNPLPGSNV